MRLNRDSAYEQATHENVGEVVFDEHHGVKIAHMKRITPKASSLGASSASAGVVKMALQHPGGVVCLTVPDEMTMWAAGRFAGRRHPMIETMSLWRPLSR
jgi:L-serine/L-threonine ammonia-lyase